MTTLAPQIDAADMPDAMANLHAALMEGPYSEALEACVPVVRQGVRDNFNSSATPDDADWPPRKIIGDGHPLLIDTGALMQAATGGGPGQIKEVGSHDLRIGVSGAAIPYAATHNYGHDAIPQREYMGLREERIDECGEIIADQVLSALFG